MKSNVFAERAGWNALLWATLAGLCAWLYLRTVGTYPSVFADEWYYSKFSRLQPLAESTIPSWLYLSLFGATGACGTGFYDCARAGNVLFFGAAAPLVYLTARHYAGQWLAALVALLSLLAPLNLYTSFFMPESMYYFGFCLLSWIALTRTGWHWALLAAGTGLVLGLMYLVKVHALFLVPSLCVFLLYARWSAGGRWLATGIGSVALAVACVFAVKFGLGYLLAGPAALNLYGKFYSGAVNSAGFRGIFSFLPAAFISARGHLMALALLAPLPVALVTMALLRVPRRETEAPVRRLQLFAVLMLGAAVALTIMFTGSIAASGPNEGVRLHLRYYSFAFPLLWLVAAATLAQPQQDERRTLRWTVALLLCAVLAIAWFKLPTYWLSVIDGPDVFAVNPVKPGGRYLLLVDVLILLLWAAGWRAAAPLYLFAALPLSVGLAVPVISEVIASNRNAGPAEQATAQALRLIPPQERNLVTVVASDMAVLMRTEFELDSADALPVMVDAGAPIEQYQLPVHNKWLLVIGQHALPAGVQPVVQTADYSLVHVNNTHRKVGYADMHQPFGKGIIAAAEGLSHIEPWGRWSDGKRVVLHLAQPLPRHARVILKALAYDVNTELPFTIRVGDASEHFRLGWTMQDVALAFDTDGNTRDVVIEVPHPIAPSERGQPDYRTLGICIADIEIGERDPERFATN